MKLRPVQESPGFIRGEDVKENRSTTGTYLTNFLNEYGDPYGLCYHTDPQSFTILGGPFAITPTTAPGRQAALG
jgi:hypothetical protein